MHSCHPRITRGSHIPACTSQEPTHSRLPAPAQVLPRLRACCVDHLHAAIILHMCVLHISASYTGLTSFGQDPSRTPVHSRVPMPHPDLLAACLDLPPSLINASRALTVYQAPCSMLGTPVGGTNVVPALVWRLEANTAEDMITDFPLPAGKEPLSYDEGCPIAWCFYIYCNQ